MVIAIRFPRFLPCVTHNGRRSPEIVISGEGAPPTSFGVIATGWVRSESQDEPRPPTSTTWLLCVKTGLSASIRVDLGLLYYCDGRRFPLPLGSAFCVA